MASLLTSLGGNEAAQWWYSTLKCICCIAALSLCTYCAFFWITGVTWPEGPQSMDRGVSVPADFAEDHPVCFRPGASTRRHYYVCGRSLWSLPYPFRTFQSIVVKLIIDQHVQFGKLRRFCASDAIVRFSWLFSCQTLAMWTSWKQCISLQKSHTL